MTPKPCDICNQPLHRHNDRTARYYCQHCDQMLCDLLVEPWPKEGGYKHSAPFCPGLVERV